MLCWLYFIVHAGYVCNILCIRSSKLALIAFGRKLHLYTASFCTVDRIPQEPIYLSISRQLPSWLWLEGATGVGWERVRVSPGRTFPAPETFQSQKYEYIKQKLNTFIPNAPFYKALKNIKRVSHPSWFFLACSFLARTCSLRACFLGTCFLRACVTEHLFLARLFPAHMFLGVLVICALVPCALVPWAHFSYALVYLCTCSLRACSLRTCSWVRSLSAHMFPGVLVPCAHGSYALDNCALVPCALVLCAHVLRRACSLTHVPRCAWSLHTCSQVRLFPAHMFPGAHAPLYNVSLKNS